MRRVETSPDQTPAGVALAVSKQPVRRARAARRKQARRARRGMAALFLSMLLAAVLGAAALAWEIGLARDRIAGQAALLAEAVAAEGYALHHWLHNNPPVPPPPGGSARVLTGVENTGLENHAAFAPYWRLARGWEVTRLMGLAQGAVAGTRIHGILVLHPPPLPLGASDRLREEMELRREEVALRLGAASRGGAAGLLANTAPGFTLDARDIAVLAAAFARIDPTVVLRSQRAGFAPPQMAEHLDLVGNNLIDVGEIEVGIARLPPLRPLALAPIELTGALDIRDDLTATGPPTELATLDVRGGFEPANTLTAAHVQGNRITISGTLLIFGTAEIGRLGGDPPLVPHPEINAGAAVFTTLPLAGETPPALSGVRSVRCGGGCPWLTR